MANRAAATGGKSRRTFSANFVQILRAPESQETAGSPERIKPSRSAKAFLEEEKALRGGFPQVLFLRWKENRGPRHGPELNPPSSFRTMAICSRKLGGVGRPPRVTPFHLLFFLLLGIKGRKEGLPNPATKRSAENGRWGGGYSIGI